MGYAYKYGVQMTVRKGFESAAAVTPSDTTNLTKNSDALFIGGAGNIAVVMADGSTATFDAVPAGTVLPISVSRVNATNTTATLIISLNS